MQAKRTWADRLRAFVGKISGAAATAPTAPSAADQPTGDSLTVSEFLEMPDDMRKFVNFMMRDRETTVGRAVAATGYSEAEVRAKLKYLLERGLAKEIPNAGEMRYRIRILHKQNRRVPDDTWRRLDDTDKSK